MCKSKAEGGLRCAGHMRPALVKAYDRYKADPSQENLDKLNEARDAYLETPEGWKKSIPAGQVEHKNADGTTSYIPLHELTDHSTELTEEEREELAQRYQDKREEAVRAYKEKRAAKEEEMLRDAVKDPEEFYTKADAFWGEEHGIEDADQFGFAPEPVEGEELDSDGYGVVSGLNEAGFDRSGNHYLTGEPYDEHGVDEGGWTEMGLHAETGWIVGPDGYTRRGFNPYTRLHRNGTEYDERGYDISGVDKDGWRESGWNADYTRHRDTTHLSAPWNRLDSEGYGPDLRDQFGYHKVEGTDRRGFLPDGRFYAHKDKPAPKCYVDGRGFTSTGVHGDTGSRFDPEGLDKDGYDIYWMDRNGHLHPDIAPNRSTRLIHTNPLYTNPLHEHGYTERNGWTTTNAKGSRKLLPVLVKTGFRYRKKPMRMLWEVGVVTVKHHKTNQKVKLYTAAPHGTTNRTVAFTQPDALMPFLKALGVEVLGKPQGKPF